jgi:MFS family permease
MYMTGAQVYLIDISTPQTRARVIAANQGALLFGVSIGPALGGLLAEGFGFRVPFFVVAVASALTAVYAFMRLPETHHGANAPARPAPTEHSAWRQLVFSRDFVSVAAVTAAVFLTRAGSRMTLMPLLAAAQFGYSAGALGVLFTVMALVNLAGLGPAATIADRFGRKWTIVPSGAIVAAALLGLALSSAEGGFLAAAALLAVGTAVIGPAPAAYVADITPPNIRGLAMGLYRSAGDVGFVLGPFLLGALADATSIPWALAVNALLFAAATASFGWLARERR